MSEVRLIDANALKEILSIKFGNMLPNVLLKEIDNAPTVKPEKVTEGELVKAYTKGFDTGVEPERPQGKWIFHKDFHASCRYGCNQCGNLTNISSNFCPNCGADMRKGSAE